MPSPIQPRWQNVPLPHHPRASFGVMQSPASHSHAEVLQKGWQTANMQVYSNRCIQTKIKIANKLNEHVTRRSEGGE